MATTSKYSVEVRNKAGNLIRYLTPWVQSLSWEWRRIGGCGNASMKLAVPYRDIDFNVLDDIQIRVKDTSGQIDGNVCLLLHCDGADESNTFTDEAGNIVTVNADAKIDTAQSKFGGSSLALDGTGDFLSLTDNANWSFGTGDFTIDFWVRMSATTGARMFISQSKDSSNRWYVSYSGTTGKLTIYFIVGNVVKGHYTCNWSPSADTWYHLAFERSGVGAYIFINGIQQSLTEVVAFSTNDVGNISEVLRIGCETAFGGFVAGWMDEIRISKGVARWTSGFSPREHPYRSSRLVYRGFVSSISPALSKSQDITVNIKGYFDLLKTIIVQDTGVEKEYASDYVYEIVNDIVTNFIEANSSITAPASVYEDAFTVDAIAFKTSVAAALDTLANLLGDVEYGVDENLGFYWQQESDTVNHKFFVGIDIEKLNRTKDYSDLVNKIYFEGAKDDITGVYKKTATSSGSISAYYLAEAILTNSAISTDTVADAYLTVLLQQKSSPKYKLSFDVPNTAKRLEDNIPMGKVSIYDDDYDRGPATKTVWGTTANGGSNKVWGTVANGGDGALWGGGGGAFQQQVEYVQYELSDTDGRFNLKIYTGGSLDKFAAKVKQLELLTADLRQRG